MLGALGVAEIATGSSALPDDEPIRLLAPGMGGYAEDGWDGFLTAVEVLVHGPVLEDVRRRLLRAGEDERHAFIETTSASHWALSYWLSDEFVDVPDRPPTLPTEITHLWLWGRIPVGRALAWFPDWGWLDVREHWRTG